MNPEVLTLVERGQIELDKVFKELDRKGCYLLLSNSNSDFIKSLYKDYRIIDIQVNRFINSNIKKE